jgi:subtilisin-like proprotein convertase family protein/subtilisin family serine protease
MDTKTYTYQGGKKIELVKKDDEFVVRATPDVARAAGLPNPERVSASSSRVRVAERELEPSMRSARALGPTHHGYAFADSGEEFLITDRVFVHFKAEKTPEQVSAFAGKYGLVLQQEYSPKDYLFQLTNHTGKNPVKLVVELQESDADVESAEHDLNQRMRRAAPVPADPRYAEQWHLHERLTHSAFDRRASCRAEGAWQLLDGFGSADVVVGVTDDGCRLDHPDFDSPSKFAGWGYFEGTQLRKLGDAGALPARMYQDGADHGTNCAGVIAAETDAALTVGAAPGCRLLPIKWESDGSSLFISDSKMMTMLDYVGTRVDVLSNSWGIVPRSLHSTTVLNRIRDLARTGGRRGKGILFLWAAGNENCPIQHSASVDVPISMGWEPMAGGDWAWVGVDTARVFSNDLVGIDGVLHVAALASTARRSHYSNYGTGIQLCAPSSNVHAYHRLTVPGLGITTTSGGSNPVDPSFGGTSSATPLVAGIAALVISANPALTALQVASILRKTAAKTLDETPYARTPPASYDADTTWDVSPIAPFDVPTFKNVGHADGTWSPWFGHGRVDAQAAVAMAIDLTQGTTDSLKRTSSPERPIPDNDPAGITDAIQITGATGRVRDALVTLNVTHTWIGDLRVTLIGPNGAAAVLHDRAGSNGDNIQRTFSVTDTPSLAAFRGLEPNGGWTLEVRDLASDDKGILKSWTLDLAVDKTLTFSDTVSIPIPDDVPAGVTRSLDVVNPATISDLTVSVDITHPWIGDLLVELTPPGGAPIRLHDREGRDADNVIRTFTASAVPGLAALRGKDAKGKWSLRVADVARRDEGKLNRWSLQITS